MLVAMDPAGIRRGSNPNPFNLYLKPELLMVLRHAGVDLLAYDGAPCSQAVGPLTEAARRIEADLCLRPVVRSVGWEGDTGTAVAEGLRWAAERCADRLHNLPLKVRSWDGTRPSEP
jgi:hypothetical protein